MKMQWNITILKECLDLDVQIPGASCSKLTMLFVNDSIKFQMAILQIHCYFLLKECENFLDSHILSTIRAVAGQRARLLLTFVKHKAKPDL